MKKFGKFLLGILLWAGMGLVKILFKVVLVLVVSFMFCLSIRLSFGVALDPGYVGMLYFSIVGFLYLAKWDLSSENTQKN